MGEDSKVPWCDNTFNPWVGCEKESAGCDNCYAERMASGLMGRKGLWGPGSKRQRTTKANWKQPLKWNRMAGLSGKRPRVFCGSMCDIFEDHPDANAIRPDLWELIQQTPNLVWMLLTKRPHNFLRFLPASWRWAWSNKAWRHVWLGVTCESGEYIDRVNSLRIIPARLRFVSCEPALGSLERMSLDGISWVIYGGESGPGYRPHNLDWARRLRDRCRGTHTAFFYKQSPGLKPGHEPTLDGKTIKEFPDSR